MKAVFILAAMLTSTLAQAFTTDVSCGFVRGEVFSNVNNQRVARSFSPRILVGGQQISAEVSGSNIYIRETFGSSPIQVGSNSCSDLDLKPGFDCWRVYSTRTRREFLVHLNSVDQSSMVLVGHFSAPGGVRQEDTYSCR
jgi:hypothetical protein